MSTTTATLSGLQADLLEQLDKAGATTTTESSSLDALKTNSLLARDVLEAMGQWQGAAYNFQCRSKNISPRGTRSTTGGN